MRVAEAIDGRGQYGRDIAQESAVTQTARDADTRDDDARSDTTRTPRERPRAEEEGKRGWHVERAAVEVCASGSEQSEFSESA